MKLIIKKPKEDGTAKGIADESKEHPSLDKSVIKQLVADHLKMDDEYYGDEEPEEPEKKEKE